MSLQEARRSWCSGAVVHPAGHWAWRRHRPVRSQEHPRRNGPRLARFVHRCPPEPVSPRLSAGIYDLTIMDDAAVRARAENMLDRYPVLRRIYSADFLERLVPDRWNLDNHLVWLLTDTAGEFATCFWAEVSDDLATLAQVGAFEVFRTQSPPDGPHRGTVGQDRTRTCRVDATEGARRHPGAAH